MMSNFHKLQFYKQDITTIVLYYEDGLRGQDLVLYVYQDGRADRWDYTGDNPHIETLTSVNLFAALDDLLSRLEAE